MKAETTQETIKLELKKVWIETKNCLETKEIKVGLQLEFYGMKYELINNPSLGVIKEDAEGFYVEWEDVSNVTRIDDTKIISRCGWL